MLNHIEKQTRHTLDVRPIHIRQRRMHDRFALRLCNRYNNDSIITRGEGVFFIPSRRNQRSIVKISYTKNTTTRSWAAHGEYLQRHHAQEIGTKGRGFNAERSDIDMKLTLRTWQQDDDPHVFKMIVSPENSHRMDLKLHAQELMQQMQKDLKTSLEWMAIDHHNTDHPHLHIIVRGIDEHGKALSIDRKYLSNGLRTRSEELVTLKLGLRLDHEQVQARNLQIERQYVTEIDRSLRRKAVSTIVSYHGRVPNNLAAREMRLQEIERLKFLEGLGLAERIAPREWRLSDDLEKILRTKQLSNDIIKSRARHNIPTITNEIPAPTQVQEHTPLTGKVIGMGLEEELNDRRYLLLEAIDGKVHYIQATNSIVKARDKRAFSNNHVITLEKKSFINLIDQKIEYIKVCNHHSLNDLEHDPKSRLTLDVLEFVKAHGIPPNQNFPEHSFAHEYANAMKRRFKELENERVIVYHNRYHQLAFNWEQQLSQFIGRQKDALQLKTDRKRDITRSKNLKNKRESTRSQQQENTLTQDHKRGRKKSRSHQRPR